MKILRPCKSAFQVSMVWLSLRNLKLTSHAWDFAPSPFVDNSGNLFFLPRRFFHNLCFSVDISFAINCFMRTPQTIFFLLQLMQFVIIPWRPALSDDTNWDDEKQLP